MDVEKAGHARSRQGLHRRLVNLVVVAMLAVAVVVSVASLALAATTSFPDVPATHPYYAAITDLASRGVIGGYANGDFGPNDPVTRQQFAKMVVLAGGYPVSEGDICPFTDVAKGDATTFFPDNFIAVCAAKGITTGTSPTTFNPSGKITRYQVVTMVVRMADNLKPGLLGAPPATWTGTASWAGDAVHGANAARAEYNSLLTGLDIATLDPRGTMSRGEVAQVLHSLLVKLAPSTTTTNPVTTSTTATTTTSSTTTSSTTTTTQGPRGWTHVGVSGDMPLARANHSMVYDSTSGKVILFGGEDELRYFKDTWSFDPITNTWTDITPSGTLPAGRVAAGLAYDSTGHKVILFGGTAGDDYGTDFNDTWAFDPAAGTWTNLKPTGLVPPARGGHAMVYVPATGKVILFGGLAGVSDLGDTWAYDPVANAWTNLNPTGEVPSARSTHSMVYDANSGKVILFGGVGDSSFDNQTWAYDPAANAWTNLRPAGELPPGRAGQSMAFDTASKKAILFGGISLSALELTVYDDSWAYDPATKAWTRLEPSGGTPPARLGHAMVYDPVTDRVILFGGTTILSYRDDTWSYRD